LCTKTFSALIAGGVMSKTRNWQFRQPLLLACVAFLIGCDGKAVKQSNDEMKPSLEFEFDMPSSARCLAAHKGAYLVAANQSLLLIDPERRSYVTVLDTKETIISLCATPNGNVVGFSTMSSDGDTVKLVDSSWKTLSSIRFEKGVNVHELALDPAGNIIAISTRDDRRKDDNRDDRYCTYYYDVKTGKRAFFPARLSDDIVTTCYSPDGKHMAIALSDGGLKVIGCEKLDGKGQVELDSRFQSLVVTSDGKHIVGVGLFSEIFVFGILDGRLLRKIEGHTKPVASVSVDAEYDLIASGSFDRSLRVFRFSSGKELGRIDDAYKDGPALVAISGVRKRIISFGVNEAKCRSWNFGPK